jgi:hypothetical protein
MMAATANPTPSVTQTPTPAQIRQLRRMSAEPQPNTYSDAELTQYIERYPLVDARGEAPWMESRITIGEIAVNPYWLATYDLNAAAADIWDEKASAVAGLFDFAADGESFSRSQAYQQAQAQARLYRSRRAVSTLRLRPAPRPVGVGVANASLNGPTEGLLGISGVEL